ncbi:YbaN family protein [Candidatus Bathyarchaeota archaeon]|nr:YbaN family protein [Candidatus Bathyarchaeota archaeon]
MGLHNGSRDDSDKKKVGDEIKKGVFFLFGAVFLILGVIGVIIPILPTTPFLLLSAACFYKSSKRMHSWMFNNRWFGDYIRNYSEGKGISLKAKLFTLSLLWILILYSILMVVDNLFIQIILLIIAIGVTIHLIKLPTLS